MITSLCDSPLMKKTDYSLNLFFSLCCSYKLQGVQVVTQFTTLSSLSNRLCNKLVNYFTMSAGYEKVSETEQESKREREREDAQKLSLS